MFVVVPGMVQDAGTGALLAMLAACLVGLATAFLYAELSSAFPVAGGEYVMVGKTLGPLPGFVLLVVNMVNNLLFPAVIGLGVSEVLAGVLPGLPVVPTAIATVLLATALGVLRIRLNAWVTGIFLAVELLALAVVCGLGWLAPARTLGELLSAPVMTAEHGLLPASLPAIGLATTIGIFALNGYGLAVYFGEDMRAARTNIARVILLAFAVTALVELLPLAALLTAAPELGALFAAPDPFGAFVRQARGDVLADILAVAIALAILNAALAGVLAYARFLFASARDRVWGLLDVPLTRIHPRFGSPHIATLLVGAAGCLACLLPLPFLLVLSGAGIAVTYLALAFAAIAGRRNRTTAAAAYRMPFFPLAPLVTVVAITLTLGASWLEPATGRPGLVATLVQIVLAVLYYRFILAPRGTWRIYDGAQVGTGGASNPGQFASEAR